MNLTLFRKWPRKNYCIGLLFVNGERFCETLEDKIVDTNKNGVFDKPQKKVAGESAIPYGKYEVIYNWSPRFGRNLPRLLNVPHFEGILIHPGNDATDSSGCILVGRNTEVGKLTQSRVTSDKLNKLIEDAQRKGEKITIEIV